MGVGFLKVQEKEDVATAESEYPEKVADSVDQSCMACLAWGAAEVPIGVIDGVGSKKANDNNGEGGGTLNEMDA